MATGKRYYWLKLKESFMTSDTIDFFMVQPNGAQYVVLYQMLCLKTINTGGRLERKIGEVLIPYDIAKITRDMKWFSEDTVRVALSLYKQFGLIYEDKNGVLVMNDHENLVGSETDYAEQKRSQRVPGRQPQALPAGKPVDNVHEDVHGNVHTDIDIRDRDKEIDTRDKRKEKDIYNRGDVDNTVSTVDTIHPAPDPEDDKADALVAYAANNLRYLSPNNVDELVSFRDSLSDDMIIWAIDQTCEDSYSRGYGYCRKILNRMVDRGFKTLGEVKAAEAERQKARETQEAPIILRRNDMEDWGELK